MAGLTMVPNVPWHRAPVVNWPSAPPREKIFRLFNCHLYREANYGYIRNTLPYVHGPCRREATGGRGFGVFNPHPPHVSKTTRGICTNPMRYFFL